MRCEPQNCAACSSPTARYAASIASSATSHRPWVSRAWIRVISSVRVMPVPASTSLSKSGAGSRRSRGARHDRAVDSARTFPFAHIGHEAS